MSVWAVWKGRKDLVESMDEVKVEEGTSLAMGRPGLQILKPGPNPAQTMVGPTRTRPDPEKPEPPKQPKLFMSRD